MNQFDVWSKERQSLDTRKHVTPKNREIWWLYLGKNIGWEQNGSEQKFLRPVLVFRLFNSKMFFGIPMTSGDKNEESCKNLKPPHKAGGPFIK